MSYKRKSEIKLKHSQICKIAFYQRNLVKFLFEKNNYAFFFKSEKRKEKKKVCRDTQS